MSLDDPFGMFLFFSLFAVLGGGAVGGGLRSLWRGNSVGGFFLIWGAGFGGIPLFIGAVNFLPGGNAVYFYAQLFVFLGAALTAALLPDDFLQANTESNSAYAGAIVGAIMAMLGGTVVLITVRQGVGIPMLIGGFFAFLGAFLLLRSTVAVLRSFK